MYVNWAVARRITQLYINFYNYFFPIIQTSLRFNICNFSLLYIKDNYKSPYNIKLSGMKKTVLLRHAKGDLYEKH